MPSTASKDTQRIAKLLARAGIASRREIERMIGEGRIAIDGKVVDTPATLLTSLHGVTVDGNAVKAAAATRLFRFHKPAGLLTTERDPQGRPTIYSRLPQDLPRVMPIGRLDMNTEGLLLLTTDGELKRELELPATGIERTYRARAFGNISQDQLETLIEGIEIEGIRYGPIDANLERRTGRNQWIELKLKEGKNREVRRVLEHLGLQISRLIRTAYGPFHLEDLAVGAVDEIRQHDLVAFRKDVTAPGKGASSPRRETKPANGSRRQPSPGRPPGRPAAAAAAGPSRDHQHRTASAPRKPFTESKRATAGPDLPRDRPQRADAGARQHFDRSKRVSGEPRPRAGRGRPAAKPGELEGRFKPKPGQLEGRFKPIRIDRPEPQGERNRRSRPPGEEPRPVGQGYHSPGHGPRSPGKGPRPPGAGPRPVGKGPRPPGQAAHPPGHGPRPPSKGPRSPGKRPPPSRTRRGSN